MYRVLKKLLALSNNCGSLSLSTYIILLNLFFSMRMKLLGLCGCKLFAKRMMIKAMVLDLSLS